MFSYLKHRRTPSNPTSPIPDQIHSSDPPLHQSTAHSHPYAPRSDVNHLPPRPQTPSSAAPSLPPITLVSAPEYQKVYYGRNNETYTGPELQSFQYSSMARTQIDSQISESHQWNQYQSPQPIENRSSNAFSRFISTQNTRTEAYTTTEPVPRGRQNNGALPFVTSSDLQTNFVPTGRRPAGARLPTPPPAPVPNATSTFESTQSRSSKTRLNLLNPMSLLARRRTSHSVPQLLPVPTIPNAGQRSPVEIYDPRIRGTRVHDFSAPRPKPNTSYDNVQELRDGNSRREQYASGRVMNGKRPEDAQLSPWNAGGHTPVFKEDFEEEQFPAAGPHVRKANDFSDLTLPKLPYVRESRQTRETREPESPEGQPPPVPQKPSPKRISSIDKELYSRNSLPDPGNQEYLEMRNSSKSKREQSRASSSTSRSRPRAVSNVSGKDITGIGLPKHMKSTSSRFSFDMIGAASQEKLLEDRHREKALRKQSTGNVEDDVGEAGDYDDEDDFDYDAMDDDDGLEERIPGVNADLDEEDEDDFQARAQTLSGFTFHSMGESVAASPITPYTPAVLETPRDDKGDVIGFAMTKESPMISRYQGPSFEEAAKIAALNSVSQTIPDSRNSGLGLQGIDVGDRDGEYQQSSNDYAEQQKFSHPPNPPAPIDEDELYFDDGMIDALEENADAAEFDESVFDNEDTDQYGRPLRPLSSLPTLYSPPLITTKPESQDLSRRESEESKSIPQKLSNVQLTEHADEPNDGQSRSSQLKPQPSILSAQHPSASLTQETLMSYQSALAAAAHAAAANGRFRRDSTQSGLFDDTPDGNNQDPPHPDHFYSPSLEDDFDYDDKYEDDAIIAEANAEALAYDEGFYSQEFGFYSAPAGTEAQYAVGGFFGGSDNLNRTQSGRVREPNLTPITERSEYSNRNSVLSLQLSYGGGPGSAPVTSPGLAQLAGMLSEHDDENMSLNALLKLRRGAWGGSQASLMSSGNGSPSLVLPDQDQANLSPSGLGVPWQQNQNTGHLRRASAFSLGGDAERDSEGSSSNASPIITFSQPAKPQGQPQLQAPSQSQIQSQPPQPQLQPPFQSQPKSQSPRTSFQPPLQPPHPSQLPQPQPEPKYQPNPVSPSNVSIPSPPSSLLTSLHHRHATSLPGSLSSAKGLVSSTASHLDAEVSFFSSVATAGSSSRPSMKGELHKHRHTGSSDSISYMKENDPVTGERWVLERRRTAESGEIQVLGREVVSGGRI